MGKGSTLRNCGRKFRKVIKFLLFWTYWQEDFLDLLPDSREITTKYVLLMVYMLHRPGKTWGCRHSRSACAWCWAPWWRRSRRARPSRSPGTARPPAAASCHAASRDVTRPHHPRHPHVSRLHCSRRGCGLPTGAARGKDGKSAARLAAAAAARPGAGVLLYLVSTPLQLWNVACLVSVWAAVVTSY